MFFEIVDVLRDLDGSSVLEVLAKIELQARRDALMELWNALNDRKEDSISRKELMDILADEIRDLEELIDHMTRNPVFDMKIAKAKLKITGIVQVKQ